MTISVTIVQAKVEKASEAEIISMLSRVVGWEVNYNNPPEARRKIDAQDHINAILFADTPSNRNGATERAREFLFKNAEAAGARDGF